VWPAPLRIDAGDARGDDPALLDVLRQLRIASPRPSSPVRRERGRPLASSPYRDVSPRTNPVPVQSIVFPVRPAGQGLRSRPQSSSGQAALGRKALLRGYGRLTSADSLGGTCARAGRRSGPSPARRSPEVPGATGGTGEHQPEWVTRMAATARPLSSAASAASAASATTTSMPDVPHGEHGEHRRAGCHGNRARPARSGSSQRTRSTGTPSAACPTSRRDLREPGGEVPPGYPTPGHTTRVT